MIRRLPARTLRSQPNRGPSLGCCASTCCAVTWTAACACPTVTSWRSRPVSSNEVLSRSAMRTSRRYRIDRHPEVGDKTGRPRAAEAARHHALRLRLACRRAGSSCRRWPDRSQNAGATCARREPRRRFACRWPRRPGRAAPAHPASSDSWSTWFRPPSAPTTHRWSATARYSCAPPDQRKRRGARQSPGSWARRSGSGRCRRGRSARAASPAAPSAPAH